MKDPEIRRELRARLTNAYPADQGTLVIDELGLCSGLVRADLVVVNRSLTAFEIKSDSDTRARLREQVRIYSRVFDNATIVVGPRHIEAAMQQVPAWWGIECVRRCGPTAVRFSVVRAPKTNPSLDPHALAQLLWRDEGVEILVSRQLLRKSSPHPRRILWKTLVDSLSIEELQDAVRTCLRARPQWRSAQRRTSGGGMYRPFAK